MPSEKFVFLDAGTLDYGDLSLKPLQRFGEIRCYRASLPSQVSPRIRPATGVITNKCRLDREVIGAAPNLRHIHITATGVNNIDLDAARERGIAVTAVTNYCTDAVAQYTMGLMLALAGRIPWYDREVRRGAWARSPFFAWPAFPVQELKGKKLAILGYGAIGKKVAKLAAAFGMEILLCRIPGLVYSAHEQKIRRPLRRVLGEADFLTIHARLSGLTRGLIDASALSTMKPGSFLINMARGEIVDERALFKALSRGGLAGAASDVLSQEPPSRNHILYKAPNLILTPHISWASVEARKRLVQEVAANIEACLKGRRRNRVI